MTRWVRVEGKWVPAVHDFLAAPHPAEPMAYCESCQNVGMSNCSDFVNCGGPRCITCKQPLTSPQPAEPVFHHPDDIAVDAFSAAMREKLAKKRGEGRGGWQDKTQCSAEWLSELLRGHIEKGDPVDVANFCMMLHQRGERITLGSVVSAEPLSVTKRWQDGDDSNMVSRVDAPVEPVKEAPILPDLKNFPSGRAEPVKGPSDSAIMFEWSQTPNTGDMRVDLIAFARALLARYSHLTAPTHKSISQNQLKG